jgi:hypothetical protein
MADATDWFRPRPFRNGLWICAIAVAIGAHRHRKRSVSSALSMGIALWYILLILKCEIRIAGMSVGYILSHALEAKWRHRRGR